MTSTASPTSTPQLSGPNAGVIDRAMAAALKASLRGPVLLPDEAGYDEARGVWNAMIDRRPRLIARCLGVADVVVCVNFAREHALTLSVKGGGHNIAGLAVSDGALTLDMSLMRGVLVDAPNRIAHVQAGCLLGDVDRETQLHGLAAVLGFVSNTGVAGLTLGGGMGYLTRRFGWTSDNVASMEVVLADARIAQTSEKENADLFWALRGGGGNFGVVTRFDYRLHSIGPEIVGGAIAWRGEEAPRVLDLYQRLTREAPSADDDAANIEWARASWQDLRRFSTGGTYVNFLNAEEGDERIRAAYGDNYQRLINVKTKWDPTNVFRVNKNIAPRS